MTSSDPGILVVTRATLGEFDPAQLPAEGALLLVDKPAGWTSFDVVAKTRGLLRIKKIGHTGTLDPMATGLLILCLGRATKLADQIQAGEKEYTGAIRFGATTPTDDAESDENASFPTDHLSAEEIREGAQRFVGELLQRPPMFSARKVAGTRLYKLARRGEEVEVQPRAITVSRFDITDVSIPDAEFTVVCSKGTYIRSLARDLGSALGSGAYLTRLRRTRSGQFHVEDAVTVDDLVRLVHRQSETPAS